MSYPSTDNETSSQIREWSVSISVSKFDYNGKCFIIRLFLGTVPPNPRNWATNNGCVGSFAVLPPMGIAAAPRANWPNVTAHSCKVSPKRDMTASTLLQQLSTLRIICNGECRLWVFLIYYLSKPWLGFGISFVQNILGLSDIALYVRRLMRNSSTAK